MFWRDFKIVTDPVTRIKNEITLKRTCEFVPSLGTKFKFIKGSFILHDDSQYCEQHKIEPDRYNFLRILEPLAKPIIDGAEKFKGI